MIKIGLGTDLTGETTSSALGSPVHFSWLQGQHIERALAVIVPTRAHRDMAGWRSGYDDHGGLCRAAKWLNFVFL